MRFDIRWNYANGKKIAGIMKGGFDNPKVSKVVCEDRLFFSGWFLSEENANIKIKATYDNGVINEHSLNTVRPDVLKAHNLTKDMELCGFRFDLELHKFSCSVSVSVEINEDSYEVWRVEPFMSDDLVKISAKNFWKSFHKNKNDSLLEDSSQKAIEQIKNFPIHKQFHVESAGNIYNIISKSDQFPFDDLNEFKDFVRSFQNLEWSINAIEKSYLEGELRYKLKNKEAEFYCIASFTIGDINFLLFSGLGFLFYVAQHITNVLIIFPEIYKVITLSKSWSNSIIVQLTALYKGFVELSLSRHLLRDIPATFKGVNLSSGRPYHFVYDYLYGMEYLNSKELRLKVVSNEGYGFLDPSLVFNNISTFELNNEKLINNELLNGNQYLVMPSFQMLHHIKSEDGINAYPLINSLTDRLKQTTLEYSNDLDWDSYDLVFWFGISDEKRKWIEQEEGIISIIEKLNNKYENLCIILDGRTSLLNKETANYENSNEYKLFESIKSNFSNVTFINLINKSMLEKIYVSSKVDCFLTSYLTDSMYVSFIQGKKGVTYIAPSAKHTSKLLHIHRNVLEIPDKYINECVSDKTDWHKISVSMDCHDVYECILTVLNEN